MTEGYVVVIGSATIDVKGRPFAEITPKMPTPGIVRNAVGGVARNIAENLARLEVPTILFSAVGNDPAGRRILNKCRAAGIDTQFVKEIDGARTGSNFVMLDADGEVDAAITDYDIMDAIDPDYLDEHAEIIGGASMVVIDATLNDDTLEMLFNITAEAGVRVAADPTNPSLAGKLCPYLQSLYLITPNASETRSLCGLSDAVTNRESALQAARSLVSLGVGLAVITLGELGLAYADAGGSGYLKAIATDVIDPTGAGDAFTGAVIFGLLNDVPVDEAMRLGITAAALTLQSAQTVLPRLSQELLYRKLMA